MFPYRYPTAWFFHRSTIHTAWNLEPAADTPVFVKPDCGYAQPGAFKRYSAATLVNLPAPEPATMALGKALAERASCRRFAPRPLTVAQLSAVLKAAYGVCGEAPAEGTRLCERPVPSAGGCYSLEVYLLLWNVEGIRSGTYHYEPIQHALECLRGEPPRSKIPSLFLDQPYLADAGALVILTAVVERQLYRYGDRGYRYLLIEAGHVAQNVGLVAAAIDVGCLNLGGFLDDTVAALLNLEQDCEVALYGIALGTRAAQDRVEGRGLGMIDAR
jgi:SagB-type dehydrogenase family enzyme